MTLNQKFFRINILVISGIILLAAFATFQFTHIISYYEIRTQLEKVNSGMLSLRRHEKDFLVRKDNKYLERYNQTFDGLIKSYNVLLKNTVDVGLDSQELEKIKPIFLDYQAAFQSVVQLQNDIGLTLNSGQYGELRTAAHRAEEVIEESENVTLNRYMLTLRRYEKNFLLYRDETYIKRFKQVFKFLKSSVARVDDAKLQRKLNLSVTRYEDNFNKLTELEISIGLTAEQGLMLIMRDKVHSGEAALEKTRLLIHKQVDSALSTAIILSVAVLILLSIAIACLLIFMARNVSSCITLFQTDVQEYVSELEAGNADLSKTVDVKGFTEIENLCKSFNQFTSVLATETQKVSELAKSSQVVKQALDNASTPALIIEPSGLVTYSNLAMQHFIQAHSSCFSVAVDQLAQAFPVNQLCSSYPEFINGIHQHQDSFKQRIEQNGLTIDWQVTPIFDENKSITGHIVEWSDQTEQLKTEIEVESVIAAAKQGDFSQSISLQGKTGFFYTVSDGLNNMIEDLDSSLTDVSQVLTAISCGNLDSSITKSYSGKLAQLAEATNSMSGQLNAAISDIVNTVNVVKKGQFDTQVSEENKQGFYLTIAHALNELSSVLNSGISDVGLVLKNIAEGDLNSKVSTQYEGKLQELADYANLMANKLDDTVGQVSNLAEHAAKGNFTVKIPTTGLSGFYLSLSENLNNLNQSTESATSDLRRSLAAMATGNLTVSINNQHQGTFDQLKQDTNTTISNLVNVLGEIKAGSSSVKRAADEISAGNLDLSRRTEQQAASLEETASSMEQMTATIIQNTESSKNASQLALKTRDIAIKGGDVVNEAVIAMGEISESSSKINDIISVIDEIAFQTNLLALNASVEAARAGEQGRGFAVVAGEVRNLAGRSATAAKEIKDLIEDSVHKVEEGKSLVNESGESLKIILQSVQEVSDLVAEIATASEEQSLGITEVNRAVTKMDEMTQQNAALVEEVAATSDAMGNQAKELESKIGFFQM